MESNFQPRKSAQLKLEHYIVFVDNVPEGNFPSAYKSFPRIRVIRWIAESAQVSCESLQWNSWEAVACTPGRPSPPNGACWDSELEPVPVFH